MFKGNLGHIGLDVSDGSLEAVQLLSSRRSKSFQVAGWSRFSLAPGVVVAGRVVKTPEFRESLRQLFSKPTVGSLDGRQVILSIPEHQAFHYVASISSWDNVSGLFGQVQSYLSSKLPMPLEEAYWDWRVVREDATRVFVYICAVPREVVDGYRDALKTLGMVVTVVEPQILSASRVFWQNLALAEPVLMIDIGTNDTSVATIDDLGIHQSSVVSAGAGKSADALANKLGAKVAVAEQVLRTIGLRQIKHPKMPVIHEAIKQQLDLILQEARQHVVYYGIQPHVQPALIKQVLLFGGGSLIPGVAEALAQELKLTVMPSAGRLTFKPPLSPETMALLMNALGAAVQGAADPESRHDDVNVLVTRRTSEEKKTSWMKSLSRRFRRKPKPETPKAEAAN